MNEEIYGWRGFFFGKNMVLVYILSVQNICSYGFHPLDKIPIEIIIFLDTLSTGRFQWEFQRMNNYSEFGFVCVAYRQLQTEWSKYRCRINIDEMNFKKLQSFQSFSGFYVCYIKTIFFWICIKCVLLGSFFNSCTPLTYPYSISTLLWWTFTFMSHC